MIGLSISMIAKQADINLQTIRFYEKRGLLPEPPRSESGYRVYSEEYVARIKFIKRAKELGFTLDEIKQLLTISEGGHDAQTIKNFTSEKIMEITKKINDLQRIKGTLQKLSDECPGPGVPSSECPIIQDLTESN
ncbi:MerR family transcriptional regulator [Rossellomorea aquimaris]|uniref:Mercuric resistance operon regulatory protein n=1 Tax=Rossellomorea aquimaris TaxID=189382 RepID=A0A366ESR0_9BACI|nr:MerR family transcriptional regulator [Rossellomorea aquimaris]RBP05334.1 MerR family mercuric resistance operon transcriptional regulator [Rossellomorea aquimaris]